MLDAHAHVMQVKLCKANTRGVTDVEVVGESAEIAHSETSCHLSLEAVDNLKWSNDCPNKYEKGKNFLPNRVIPCLPRGMRKFHDWYLRAQITELEILQAWIPADTFGAIEFKDIQACFHLGRMEMNLIRMWCL